MKAGEAMKKKEQKIVRFYSDKPEHRKAFDILQRIDDEKYPSIQEFIISAINLLGDMENKGNCVNDDSKDWEQPLIERISNSIETIIDEKLPQIIATYLLGIQAGQTINSLPASTDAVCDSLRTENKASLEESVQEAVEDESDMEKDLEANDMLDLDSFFL